MVLSISMSISDIIKWREAGTILSCNTSGGRLKQAKFVRDERLSWRKSFHEPGRNEIFWDKASDIPKTLLLIILCRESKTQIYFLEI